MVWALGVALAHDADDWAAACPVRGVDTTPGTDVLDGVMRPRSSLGKARDLSSLVCADQGSTTGDPGLAAREPDLAARKASKVGGPRQRESG